MSKTVFEIYNELLQLRYKVSDSRDGNLAIDEAIKSLQTHPSIKYRKERMLSNG